MTQLSKLAEPFGEVNIHTRASGELEIVATILIVPDLDGARAGLALDASASMKRMYGASGVVSGIFGSAAGLPNIVEPVARTMANFMTKFSSNGKVLLIYWACSPDGSKIEEIGELDEQESLSAVIRGPKRLPWGRGTRLLPPIELFVERFKGAPARGVDKPAAICVFVTDGIIEDLQLVKDYCFSMARRIGTAEQPFIKFFLLGVGEEVDEAQMTELDDMFEGTDMKDHLGNPIDLWDHQLASDMTSLEQLFKEFVSEKTIVIPSGRVVDQAGTVCQEYADGVPALMRFVLPAGSSSFTLEFAGGKVTQELI